MRTSDREIKMTFSRTLVHTIGNRIIRHSFPCIKRQLTLQISLDLYSQVCTSVFIYQVALQNRSDGATITSISFQTKSTVIFYIEWYDTWLTDGPRHQIDNDLHHSPLKCQFWKSLVVVSFLGFSVGLTLWK